METNKSAFVEALPRLRGRRGRNQGRLKKREGIRKTTHASAITSVGLLARAEVGLQARQRSRSGELSRFHSLDYFHLAVRDGHDNARLARIALFVQ
jgi:hypothetical protein